jgi:hypothetical protein
MSRAFKVHEIPGQSIDNVNWKAVASGSGAVVTTDGTQTLTNKTAEAMSLTGATTIADGATIATPIMTVDVQALVALGTNQATAAPITVSAPGFVYSTGGNNAVGILLPTGNVGDVYDIKNGAADILFVYPAVNCTINAIAANTKINLPTVTSATFIKLNTTSWQTIPTVPS